MSMNSRNSIGFNWNCRSELARDSVRSGNKFSVDEPHREQARSYRSSYIQMHSRAARRLP